MISIYTTAIIAMLSDWLKNRSDAIFSTNEKETQTNRTLFARFFPRFEKTSQVAARNSDWCIALFAPVVIGRRSYFGICFPTDSHLKTAQKLYHNMINDVDP